MNFTTNIVEKIARSDWDKKLLEKEESTVYQTQNWSKVYQKSYDSIPVFIAVLDEQENVVGQLAVLVHTKYFWKDANSIMQKSKIVSSLGSTINWWYGPIIFDNKNSENIVIEIINALEKIARKYRVQMIKGAFPALSNYSNDVIFKKNGYEAKLWATYILDLNQKNEELFNKFNKKIRYDIRNALKNNLEFEVASEKSDLEKFAKLKSIEKNSSFKQEESENFRDSHWEFLQKNNYEKLFLAKYQNEIVGGVLALVFNGYIIQHGVVVDSNKKNLGIGTFLTWETIKWGVENDYKYFDFGGVNPYPKSEKERQIDFYKSKWGGVKMNYSTYSKIIHMMSWKLSKLMIKSSLMLKK